MTSYLLERAWVDGAVQDDVLVEIDGGRFTSVILTRQDFPFPDGVPSGQDQFHRVPGEAARLAGLGDWPVIPTQAGHDAGILSDAGIPTAMVFVRNPTGVSHSPDERAETADCLAGVEALADVLAELAGA